MQFKKCYLAQFVTLTLIAGGGIAYATDSTTNKSATDKEESVTLNPVIVRAIVPTNVTVLNRNDLKKSSTQNIKDLSLYETGVEVTTDKTQLGHTNFSIRGVGGNNRVLMTVDDMPLPDAQSDISMGGTTRYISSRDLVEFDTVNNVEVFKGGNGTAQGDGAVAGSVNMRTYTPFDLVSDDKPLYFGVKYGYRSLYSSHGTTATLAGKAGVMSGLLMLTKRNMHEYKSHKDTVDVQGSARTATNRQDSEQNNVLMKLNFGEKEHILETTVEHFTRDVFTLQEQNFAANLGAMVGKVESDTTDDKYNRDRLSIAYHYYPTDSKLSEASLKWYYQTMTLDNLTVTDYTNLHFKNTNDYKQSHNGFRFDLVNKFDTGSLQHNLQYGLDYRTIKTSRYIFKDQTGVVTANAEEAFFPPNKRALLSAYLQDNMIFQSGIELALGLRYEMAKTKFTPNSAYLRYVNPLEPVLVSDTHNKAFLPSIGLTVPITDNFRTSLAYRKGYRMPDVNFVGAAYDNTNVKYRVIPNADIKPESSNNFELGFNYANDALKVNLTTFYSKYKDFISVITLPINNRIGYREFTYGNLGRVKTYGAELSASYALTDHLSFSGNITYMRGKTQTGDALESAYPLHGVFGVDYRQEKWGTSGKVRWAAKHSKVPNTYTTTNRRTGAVIVNEYFKTPGYAVVDLSAYYKPWKNFELSASVYNLFNKKYWDSSAGAMLKSNTLDANTAPGRNFAINAELKF